MISQLPGLIFISLLLLAHFLVVYLLIHCDSVFWCLRVSCNFLQPHIRLCLCLRTHTIYRLVHTQDYPHHSVLPAICASPLSRIVPLMFPCSLDLSTSRAPAVFLVSHRRDCLGLSVLLLQNPHVTFFQHALQSFVAFTKSYSSIHVMHISYAFPILLPGWRYSLLRSSSMLQPFSHITSRTVCFRCRALHNDHI
ncbi:hypothetical protein BXZ70DRAFT_791280 [Cristinia sonorae]|uniref:Uncharacterized protein n=1 Tax=Cristinia sonorae TaxID=1940300 RepID=A0A8K0XRR3_9AGAR|nr:hypothetical protein BXZ70DRAFT_791280 [Cristinia sonorae]